MSPDPSRPGASPHHVSVVALPDAVISTLSGLYDVMNAFAMMGAPQTAPFDVEIVGERRGTLDLASGVPVQVQRDIDSLARTDIVIVPSVLLAPDGWQAGRYPRLVAWLHEMHARGALLCSACSGLFLLAETGLFDGKHSTVHFGYADAFARAFPQVPIDPQRVLMIAGPHEELISSGASTSWHDMALYLIARFAGSTAAQSVVRFFALQWHPDSLAPYVVFEGRLDHGDADIRASQQWLTQHLSVPNPVEAMIRRSPLAERTFKRRFADATGLAPLAYVQRLRVEDAKRRLERTETSIDDISWQVGYEDPAFFRRLFKRVTGLTPGTYRRRFRVPDFEEAVSA